MSTTTVTYNQPWPAEPFGASWHSLPADPTSVIHPSALIPHHSSPPQLNADHLIEGTILHFRTMDEEGNLTRYGKLITATIGSWGTHDAMVVRHHGEWYAGDAISPFCRLTPIEDINRMLRETCTQVRLYYPAPLDGRHIALGTDAAAWWINNVQGRPYDWRGILFLGIKRFLSAIPVIRHWEWAYWCTEGVGQAWAHGAGITSLADKPTPGTVEKRAAEGHLIEISKNQEPITKNH